MANLQAKIVFVIAICLTINLANGITRQDLFPFAGPDDEVLTGKDEGSSQQIKLSSNVILFERSYDFLFVSINGVISFLSDAANYLNYALPLSIPMIAPFYADIDTRITGKVYYRQTTNPDQLNLANGYISSVFTSGLNFQANSLFIATWVDVGPYRNNLSFVDPNNEKKNTFQVVIATDGKESYAFFLYPQKGITWAKSDTKEARDPALAQVGFIDLNGYQFYPLDVSGTSRTLNLDRMSNIKEAGIFIFRIGKLGVSGGVIEPDRPSSSRESDVEPSDVMGRCETTFDPCPPEAHCEQYSTGFCCKCKEGFIGNGRQCIKSDTLDTSPIRLVGQVHGIINDQKIGDADIYVYADVNSGQIYTTISRLQNIQPSDFQSLIPLTDLIGWLFAKGQPGTVNGFSLTGGVFNRTARITFPQTGEQVTVTERYLGLDVFGNLKMDIVITGNLPAIPMGSRVEFDDAIEVYAFKEPGMFTSSSGRSYRLTGASMDIPISIEQEIQFTSCSYAPKDQQVKTIKISANRYNIDVRTIQDPIRFTAEYSVVPPDDNPCKNGNAVCGANSQCVVDGENYRCVCNPGFASNDQSDPNSVRPLCLDIDECVTNQSRCHKDARCQNQPGNYRCICNDGFVGDGYRCRPQDSMCGDKFCDPNADCLPSTDGSKKCICLPGFTGNGILCRSVLGQPGSANACPADLRCDRNAQCAINPVTREYGCVCNPGFTGNGLVCELAGKVCSSDANCGENGQCKTSNSEVGYCVCKQGYYGDGYTCIRTTEPKQIENCFTSKICDVNAVCNDLPNGETKCMCNEGYTGDGRTCTIISDCKEDSDCPASSKCDPLPEIVDGGRCTCIQGFAMIENTCVSNDKAPCNVVKNCHADATCKFNLEEKQFKCECNKGFKGDGKNCESTQIPCNVLNTCGSHATCDYNPIELGYRCMCLSGYVGDGYTCLPSSSCRDYPYQCHRDAECVFSPTTREYKCRCNNGFSGDGLDCSPNNRYDGPYLVAVQGMSFARLPMAPGRQGELLFVLNNNLPVGIAFDCAKGSLYYTDIIDKAISKAGLNGSHDITILTGLISPEGLAIDWISRNIYWTDSLKRAIQVSRLNGSSVRTLISDDLINPRGIALHPGLGKMYFTDWNRASPKIEMANMDGTGRNVLVSEAVKLPNMLAIDYMTNELCWTDAGLKRIECIDLYGSKRRLVHYTSGYPFDLAIVEDYIFWTDWETNNVHRVGRNGGKEETLMIPKGSNGRLHGIVAMAEACPAMSNPCRIRNGGCKHLCLPSGPRSRTCVCPDDDGSGEECTLMLPPRPGPSGVSIIGIG